MGTTTNIFADGFLLLLAMIPSRRGPPGGGTAQLRRFCSLGRKPQEHCALIFMRSEGAQQVRLHASAAPLQGADNSWPVDLGLAPQAVETPLLRNFQTPFATAPLAGEGQDAGGFTRSTALGRHPHPDPVPQRGTGRSCLRTPGEIR